MNVSFETIILSTLNTSETRNDHRLKLHKLTPPTPTPPTANTKVRVHAYGLGYIKQLTLLQNNEKNLNLKNDFI